MSSENNSMSADYVSVAQIAAGWRKHERAAKGRLAQRLKEHGVAKTPYMPVFNNVLVLRLPAPPIEKMTAGGLHIPETAQEEPEPRSEGVLVQAGCEARDALRAHGVLIGDRVQIGRFAGWEREFALDRDGKNVAKVLQMKEHDILGSFDLGDRLWGPEPSMHMEWDGTSEEHRIVPLPGGSDV